MINRELRRRIFEFIKTLVVAFILAELIMTSVAQAFQVEQYSMEPSLMPHDRVIVNKFLYYFRPPRPGEIVVLRPPIDPGRSYIKRVVAVAGQTVKIEDGRVYVDGSPLREPYIQVVTRGRYGPKIVPPHEIFVLGDNRGNSEDSRSFGFVPMRNVTGEAMLIYWPPERFRVI